MVFQLLLSLQYLTTWYRLNENVDGRGNENNEKPRLKRTAYLFGEVVNFTMMDFVVSLINIAFLTDCYDDIVCPYKFFCPTVYRSAQKSFLLMKINVCQYFLPP